MSISRTCRPVIAALAIAAVPGSAQPSPESLVMEALPEHLAYGEAINLAQAPTIAARQIYAGKRRWQSGQTLRICFFGGGVAVRRLIAETASLWLPHMAVGFDFGDPTRGYRDCQSPTAGFNEIRVGFAGGGLWSAIGRDSVTDLTSYQPSMSLQRFDIAYRDGLYDPASVVAQAQSRDKAIILHEFGHALGLLHEQQNPALGCEAQIRWTGTPTAYDVLGGDPNYWGRDLVDRNLKLMVKYDPDYVVGSPDPASIMIYELDSRIFLPGANPGCIMQRNLGLSAKDKEIIGRIYPKVTASQPTFADTDPGISGKSFQSLPASAPIGVTLDYEARLLADLESSDALVRRDARARLSQYVAAGDKTRTDRLVANIGSQSYRYQLGVAVALNKAGSATISPTAASTLGSLYKSTNDATLKSAISAIEQ